MPLAGSRWVQIGLTLRRILGQVGSFAIINVI